MGTDPKKIKLRIGQGYDIHRLVEGRPLILAGVTIPFEKGPLGHSDGDAVYHAVCEALLGALALGDIGSFFPDTDPRWKNADSRLFVEAAIQQVRERGFSLSNLDINLQMEKPKIGPHKSAMIANLAKVLDVDPGQISLKPRRGEGVDAVGRGEAVVAQAICLLMQDE